MRSQSTKEVRTKLRAHTNTSTSPVEIWNPDTHTSIPVHQIHTNDWERVVHLCIHTRERYYHELWNPKALTHSQCIRYIPMTGRGWRIRGYAKSYRGRNGRDTTTSSEIQKHSLSPSASDTHQWPTWAWAFQLIMCKQPQLLITKENRKKTQSSQDYFDIKLLKSESQTHTPQSLCIRYILMTGRGWCICIHTHGTMSSEKSGSTHSIPVHQVHTNDRKRVAHPWVCQIIQKAKRERNYHELRNPKMLTQSQNNWKRVVVKGKDI